MSAEQTKTVAIVGASSDRAKFGNKSLRAHRDAGFAVYPVHPTEQEVEGERAYRAIGEIPVDLNRVSLYVPPSVGLKLLEQIAEKGCQQLWLNPGTESDEILERARQLGLNAIEGCSIIDVGASPSQY